MKLCLDVRDARLHRLRHFRDHAGADRFAAFADGEVVAVFQSDRPVESDFDASVVARHSRESVYRLALLDDKINLKRVI